ncbi:PTS sugar transporter subunit IIB [Clostridium senegalense]|uniref:PTS sugar transporter subunit IIB n=1 Tax=Clostridium senegalense TaxID=1465809 RepID=UPI000288E35A|nr:PTS sugar transporter subunit IIB [Clostridium senegalense]MBU5227682.1 PTS sugar transporter subunit IIB [Clostridium senegalense]
MKKIMLVCCAGMSTSLLVEKMEKAAAKDNINVKIIAVGEIDLKNHMDVDVVLLGPQVRYLLNKIRKTMEPKGIPVDVIDSMMYGTMNGEKVLKKAMELINNSK